MMALEEKFEITLDEEGESIFKALFVCQGTAILCIFLLFFWIVRLEEG
jgi:hypothetical protein